MKFMGSKRRIAKYILPILKAHRHEGQAYVEPFVGGANMIECMDGWRIGADHDKFLIAFWQALVTGWTPPQSFTEEDYHRIRQNKDDLPHLTGYVGYSLSYGGKWFGGWRRDSIGKRDYVDESYRGVMKQRSLVTGVQFVCSDYRELRLPEGSLVYCDPPYANSTKYKTDFDHDVFWQWTQEVANQGHTVFVSSYDAPDFAECVWEKQQASSLTKDTGSKKAVERLFHVAAQTPKPIDEEFCFECNGAGYIEYRRVLDCPNKVADGQPCNCGRCDEYGCITVNAKQTCSYCEGVNT